MTNTQKLLFLIVTLISTLAVTPSFAQFNIRNTASHIQSKKDSIKVVNTSASALNLQLYNEAYDVYLRKMRFKERNTIKFEGSLTFNQNQFTNWAAGGSNNISLRTQLKVEHKYTKRIFGMTTSFNAALGVQHTDDITRKNEDWLNISITPGWRFANRWMVSASMIFKTGMTNSYEASSSNMVSTFLSPASLLPTAGIGYKDKKGTLDLYFAPISGNLIIVGNTMLANRGGFGIPKGDKFGAELGAFFRLIYGDKFWGERVSYNTKLETFIRYNSTPTLWWENNIGFKITKILGVKLYVLAIYNDQIATPKSKDGVPDYLQINESFGFGITYNIQSKKYNAPPENLRTKARNPKLMRR